MTLVRSGMVLSRDVCRNGWFSFVNESGWPGDDEVELAETMREASEMVIERFDAIVQETLGTT
jgi:hypothetical protein